MYSGPQFFQLFEVIPSFSSYFNWLTYFNWMTILNKIEACRFRNSGAVFKKIKTGYFKLFQAEWSGNSHKTSSFKPYNAM